jgi:hypothetical protein
MMHRFVGGAVVLSTALTAGAATGQTTRTEAIDDQKAAKAATIEPVAREPGDVIITRLENLFTPEPPAVQLTFGDFRPGAGLGLGLGYAMRAGDRGIWRTAAAYSTRNFKQVESAVDIPPLSMDRVRVHSFVRWDDAPDLAYFGRGLHASSADEVSYALRTMEAGAELQARTTGSFRYGAGASVLAVHSSDGAGFAPVIGSVPPSPGTAGVGSSPSWLHTMAYAAFDSRTSPGYTDSGGLYRVAFHDYTHRGNTFDFARTEIDLRQFIPVLHHNWIIALQARADLTRVGEGQQIPFFMLPSIGGRDTLPGFEDYRFTDNDSLLLRSELRWTPTSVVDTAVFVDQGTVAASAGELDLHDMKRSWGVGVRFHGPTFTALRLEVAHSVEGWHYNIAHTVSF